MTALFWVFMDWLLLAPAQTFSHVGTLLPYQDKIVHLVSFGILTMLVRWAIPNPWGRGWQAGGVILALSAYGVGAECIQALVPSLGRSFEWTDIMVDCIGVVAGMWLCGRLVVSAAVCPVAR